MIYVWESKIKLIGHYNKGRYWIVRSTISISLFLRQIVYYLVKSLIQTIVIIYQKWPLDPLFNSTPYYSFNSFFVLLQNNLLIPFQKCVSFDNFLICRLSYWYNLYTFWKYPISLSKVFLKFPTSIYTGYASINVDFNKRMKKEWFAVGRDFLHSWKKSWVNKKSCCIKPSKTCLFCE